MLENELKLSVIFPIYNEEMNILPVIADACNSLDRTELEGRYELILINDGSTDGSAELIDDLKKQYAFIKIIHHPKNLGFGQALISGFRIAEGKYVSFLPSDGEIKMQEVCKFYNQIANADILISQRYCPDLATQKSVRPWYRNTFSWAIGIMMRFLIRFDPKDAQGIFLVKGNILKNIEFRTNSSLVALEVIIYCAKNNYQFAKGVMNVSPRLSGVSKVTNIRVIYRTLFDIFALSYLR